ncbi:MAG: hypothetical protein IV100_01585 [Myxococcales bacterium]|nr:hypothetical protein [Myxococcales bacterium]
MKQQEDAGFVVVVDPIRDARESVSLLLKGKASASARLAVEQHERASHATNSIIDERLQLRAMARR